MENERSSGISRVRGRVRLDGGDGYVRYADVQVIPKKARNQEPLKTIQSDDTGRFSFGDDLVLEPGQHYQVIAKAFGVPPVPVDVDVSGARELEPNIDLGLHLGPAGQSDDTKDAVLRGVAGKRMAGHMLKHVK